jgi:hypothetical protein
MRAVMVAALVVAAVGWACARQCAYAQPAQFLDPVAEYKQAYEAEQKGDFETALLHWENLIDSCDIDAAMRLHVVGHVRAIRPKVAVDPKKEPSNTWTCLVLVYRNLDFEWTDKAGNKHHIATTMSDDDVKAVREGMDNFAKHVIELSSRELRINYRLEVVDRTITNLVGENAFWFAPAEAAKDMAGVENAAYDTVFAFTKFQQGEKSPSIPGAFGGGSLGADAGPKSCGYINIPLWAGGLKPGARDGEIELHEWLHNVDWAFTAVQGYPDDICPTPDGGRVEGDFGGDPDYRRPRDYPKWMPYYEHMMRDHVTRRMWRGASMHRVPRTPWTGRTVSEWLVLGPFEKTGGKTFGTAFINEETIAPRPDFEMQGMKWRSAQSTGLVLDLDGLFNPNENVVAYAHVYVHSDAAQRAQLRLGSDDGAAVWHNGKLIYRSEVPRALTMDVNSVDIMLTEGWNSFLFKVDELSGGWALSVRFVGPDGQPLKGVRYSATGGD